MAPAPEGTDPPEIQTVALRVSIHCEGCKKKVKKVVQRVEGVGHIDIDSKQNKVTVTGSASAESLIQKLGKYGKQAELWPDTKPSAAGKSCGETKEEGKEKAAASSTATATPPETEQQQKQQPTTEKKQQAEESKLIPPPPTETTKTAPTVPATAASGDVTASKDKIDAPELNPSEAPAKSEKPADSENSNKKGKKVEITGDESAVSDINESAAPTATVAAMNPPTPHPFQAYPLPSYTMSYNTVRPSISYSHYAPSPAIPSSYTTYSAHPTPAALPSSYAAYSDYPPLAPSMLASSHTTYSSYTSVPSYPPENYSTDSYYGSMESPAAAEGSYDMFNDENPNACNLM